MMKRLALAGLAAAGAAVACANETRVLANGEIVEIFDTVGDFAWTAPFDANVELLVVGGGGGGGCGGGGGGGGGGQVYHTTAFPVRQGTTYFGSVGEGGRGGTNGGASVGRWQGANGEDSVFASITCPGGGGGGGHAGSAVMTGVAGGNSGGASSPGGTKTSPDATGTDDAANGWYGGHKGGDSVRLAYAGGGGGAMGEGGYGFADAEGLNHSGNGADGFECAITGTAAFYGCGGGGGCNGDITSPYALTIAGGDAGSGNASGGAGAKEHRAAGSAATDGTGSGGGGGGWLMSSPTEGGKGGSGIVVIRYVATGPVVRLTAYDGFADGQAHSVAVEVLWPASGAQVEHSTDGETWGERPAAFATFGNHAGWVRVTAPGTELEPCVLTYSIRIKDPSAENDGTFRFVAPAGESTPEAPYATWATAANDLATALAAADAAGDTVLVAPGTYAPDAALLVPADDVTIRSCRPADGATDTANTILDGSRLTGVSLLGNDAKLRPVVAGLTFRNCATGAEKGGAINFSSAGAYRIRDCVFADNTVTASGGAICSTSSNGGLISGCVFCGNSATNTANDASGGGALFASQSASSSSNFITLQNCTFSNNFAAGAGPYGGAVQARHCIRIFDCLFATNGLTVRANTGHGGSANVGQYSLVSNTTFVGWHSATYGVVLRVGEMSHVVDCRFERLWGSGSYGVVHLGAKTVAERCRFTGCERFDMFMTEASGSVVRNCLMGGCTGGNFLRAHGKATLRSEHCTFAGNASGCRIFNNSGSGTTNVVVNCIYVGNGGPGNSASHTCFVTNSAVSLAPAGTADSGVIVTTDPGFRSVARQDYRLKADSVGVDAGLALDWSAQGRDLVHDARWTGAAPDLGCYVNASPARPIRSTASGSSRRRPRRRANGRMRRRTSPRRSRPASTARRCSSSPGPMR
ncbi:MAG: right-handed parallel beta-helix repeat-containing protein [Kiritimatiellia bacterium]